MRPSSILKPLFQILIKVQMKSTKNFAAMISNSKATRLLRIPHLKIRLKASAYSKETNRKSTRLFHSIFTLKIVTNLKI